MFDNDGSHDLAFDHIPLLLIIFIDCLSL